MNVIVSLQDVSCITIFLGIFMLYFLAEVNRKGIKTILVPTDFSAASDVALQVALDLAEQQKARIYLVHVLRHQAAGATKMMQRQLAMFPESKSVEIVPAIRKGKIHEEILKTQREKDIDLIVIAPHSKKTTLRTFFKSVTEKVRREAQCSVLVVGA